MNAVEMIGIKKSFGGIHALRGVDFSVRPGTIHALVGENGAGKSTLLKILQGVQAPSEGEIRVFGEKMVDHTATEARRLGIGMIFQELSLVPTMSVAANIFLNREPRQFGNMLLHRSHEEREAAKLLNALGLDINPKRLVSELSSGQRQMTEIAKAMSQKARVLILDEPTSALSSTEVEHLFKFLRRVRGEGMSAIYVSHRMDEIAEIADEVTILRDGSNVAAAPLAEMPLESIVETMIGRRVTNFAYVPRTVDRAKKPLLRVTSLTSGSKPNDVSFDVYPGEIVGIAGLMGSGRTEIARAIYGIDKVDSGEVLLAGKKVDTRSPGAAIAAGIVLVPESRQREGLIVDHSVAANLSLPQIGGLTIGPLIDFRKEGTLSAKLIEQLRVKTRSPAAPVRSLSGGNQQKVVIAKWLATDPQVVILDEPTAGIDIGSKGEIVDLIRAFADGGKAVIVISSEAAELLALSDRVLVIADGRVARSIERLEIDSWAEAGEGGSDTLKAEHGLQVAIQRANANVH